jgi:hypothetical protein
VNGARARRGLQYSSDERNETGSASGDRRQLRSSSPRRCRYSLACTKTDKVIEITKNLGRRVGTVLTMRAADVDMTISGLTAVDNLLHTAVNQRRAGSYHVTARGGRSVMWLYHG